MTPYSQPANASERLTSTPAHDRPSRTKLKHAKSFLAETVEPLERRMLLSAAVFAAAVTSTINTSEFPATAFALGDVNGDGLPDLVIGHGNGSGQVFLGKANGTFLPSTLVGPISQVLTLADFNGDGKLDVASAVGVLPGTGTGTFTQAKAGFTLPANSIAFYSADINGDGKQDLIDATFTPAASTTLPATVGMDVFLGNGDGTFKAPIVTTLGSGVGLTKADATLDFDDFNNDSKVDVYSPFGVSLGNGDGTFKAALALPISFTGSTGPTTPPGAAIPLPASPDFAVGDFNGDGRVDIATVPLATATSSNVGIVQILLGKGDGTFSVGSTVSLGTTATITTLAAADLNADGNIDLMAGTISGNTSAVNVLQGNGDGTFAPPMAFPVSGPPLSIRTGDLNGDGAPDIISIDATPGTVPGVTVAPPATIAALLSAPPATKTPVVSLSTSAARVVAGATVRLGAVVTPPRPAPVTPGMIPKVTNSPTPTGNVVFSDGTLLIGFARLVNGRATITWTATGLGIQSITVAYSGDANYANVTSVALAETVLLSSANAPLLIPSLTTLTAPSLFLPRDTGTISIGLLNGGGGTASGRIAVNLFVSTDGRIDSNSIQVSVPTLQNRAIVIGSGRTATLTASFTLGNYPPASYKIIAQIVPLTVLTAAEFTADTLLSPTSFQAAGLVFGTVGAHHGLTLTLTDAAGDRATLAMLGAGTGTATQTSSVTDVTVTGASNTSTLQITRRSGVFQFDAINVTGPIGTISGPSAAVTGHLTVSSSIASLILAAAGTGSTSVPINLGSGSSTILSLGTVQAVALNSAAPIRSLVAATWEGGSIIAPSITTLSVRGTFNADVQTHTTTPLQTALLGDVTGGTWAIAGNIGVFHVLGDLTGTRIFAGVNAGPDDTFATGDDTYAPAIIVTILIGGADTSTIIASGATPPAGGTLNDGFTLLPKSAIRSVTVRGEVSPDSLFAGAALPVRANLGGVLVTTAGDSRFQG